MNDSASSAAASASGDAPTLPGEGVVCAWSDNRGFRTALDVAGHALVADEPVSVGGTDAGPSPYGLISAALASCTAMTLHSYAKLKRLPVTGIRVQVRHSKVHELDCEQVAADASPQGKADGARIDRLERVIRIDGELDEAVRKRMLQVADRCPVHRTLQGDVRIVTTTE